MGAGVAQRQQRGRDGGHAGAGGVGGLRALLRAAGWEQCVVRVLERH